MGILALFILPKSRRTIMEVEKKWEKWNEKFAFTENIRTFANS